jgi:hypothetical protein
MPHHIIETDFEPDDAIAILAHANISVNIHLTVIVGESKPNNKISCVKKFFKELRVKYPNAYEDVNIIQGFGSKKMYPIEDQTEYIEDSEDTILQNYTIAYSKNPEIVYMMKPPREAMKLKLVCKQTVVYCYGSFNWRTLKLPVQDFRDLISRYKKFYYFDSFTAIGEKNSGMFNGSPSAVNSHISDLIIRWNKHIIVDCENDLNKLMTKENNDENEKNISRTRKIIDNVSKGKDKQFVMADITLFLCPPPTEQVDLLDVNPYPKWVPSTTSNVYVFSSSPVFPEGSTSETNDRRNKLINELNLIID